MKLMREKVMVTPRSVSRDGHPSLQAIVDAGYRLVFPAPGQQPSEDELIATIGECVGYVAGVEPITAAVLGAADKLQVISRNGAGTDNIDLAVAQERNIIVERAIGANARGVAELVFGHLLSAARSIPRSDNVLKTGCWERIKGRELEGRTLAVIGYGAVGRIVAKLGHAFDMKVIVHDPFLPKDCSPSPYVEMVTFEIALKHADAITLHCPPEKDRYLIGPEELDQIKTGAILVNTARDGLVDLAAVASALDSGRLSSFTIDAFSKEPPENYEFLQKPQVIATPHIGGFTDASVDRAVGIAVDNLLRILRTTT